MNNYKPTPSQRKDKRYKKQLGPALVETIDEQWLEQYKGQIDFWSMTLFSVNRDTLDTTFRVYTRNHIPEQRVQKQLEKYLPEFKVHFVWPYQQRNTFIVRTSQPLPWGRFKWLVVNALGDYL